MSAAIPLTGALTTWKIAKGFRFLTPDQDRSNSRGLFVYVRDIAGLGAGETLREGQRLSFTIGRDRDGLRRAADVRYVR